MSRRTVAVEFTLPQAREVLYAINYVWEFPEDTDSSHAGPLLRRAHDRLNAAIDAAEAPAKGSR